MILGRLLVFPTVAREVSLIKYGRLYNFPSAANANIAPVGWSCASEANWATLVDYINTNYNTTPDDFGTGNHLKHRRQNGSVLGSPWDTTVAPSWSSDGTHYGRDTLLFGGLPAGIRLLGGTFSSITGSAYFHTSTAFDSVYGYIRRLISNNGDCIQVTNLSKGTGSSIKCVRTATTEEQSLADGTLIAQVTDVEGNIYDPVKIGTQVWFIQNLATTKLNNETSITLVTSGTGGAASPEYYNYNNDTSNTFFSSQNDSIWIPSLMIKP